MAQISITRALTEVKILAARIDSAIAEGTYVSVTKGLGASKKTNLAGETVESVSAKIVASHNSVLDLMTRRSVIKAAIIASNAVTKVQIGAETMTVAEAIDRKSMIGSMQSYVNAMRLQYGRAQGLVDQLNTKMQAELDTFIANALGKDKAKYDQALVDGMTATFKNEREADLLDPAGILAKIETKSKQLADFVGEVDFALSESNARTMIEVAD